ncbi:MAG: hypothetical protein AAGM84_16600 [Pseudomonadota bacterium]
MRTLTSFHFTVPLARAATADGTSATASHVAEIVTFRVTDGTSASQVAQAAASMQPFLKAQGGMIRRSLSVDADGLWTDHIIWTSMEAAQTAAASVMEAPEVVPFMSLIVPESVAMRHAAVHLAQE